ncbi:MAG: acyltransferase [Ignavibacteriaceae bacterium]|nr:acyltransferase [Ignavibacteriaceae bacterium]HRP93624.1 acyltransferase [Ignavibacteriaceae bacterium]
MILAELYYKLRKKTVPYYAKYPVWLIIWKPIRKFINVVIIPNVPIANIRILMYRYFVGYKIGKNVFIGMKCYLDDLEPQKTIIEDRVVISYGCYFSLHGINQKHSFIHIKNGAYLGMRVTVVAGNEGITIGENTLVGAASLVNKSLPANVKAVGVPAKMLNV